MGNYLITGGAGFIGSHIARALVNRGDSVKVFDNFSTGKRENLDDLDGKVAIHRGDLRDVDSVTDAMRDIDVVYHEAALASVPRSIADPVSTNAVNIDGTLNLLCAARDAKVKRFVFASSSSVYGDQPGDSKREDMRPTPLSPYAVSKYVGELYGKVFHDVYGLPFVGIRYFNVFGPYQDEDSDYAAVIPIFSRALLTGKAPIIYGDGRQTRDFTFVGNVVQANLLAAERKQAVGRIMNVACGGSYDLNYLLSKLQLAYETNTEAVYKDARMGDVKHSKADISLAREALGYEPATGFEEGLKETAQWYLQKISATPSNPNS